MRGAREISRDAPDDAAQDAAAVERESRDEIEERERKLIRASQPAADGNHFAAVHKARDQPEAPGKKKARKRAGDRDVEFLAAAVRIALDVGKAAEDEQRDRADGNAVMAGDDAVAELVKNDRGKKEQARDDAESPALGIGPMRMWGSELRGERERDQGKDDEPARVQVDRDAEDASDAEPRGWGCLRHPCASEEILTEMWRGGREAEARWRATGGR